MEKKNEKDHGAGLIHQAIPDMAGTEPRLNEIDAILDRLEMWSWTQ